MFGFRNSLFQLLVYEKKIIYKLMSFQLVIIKQRKKFLALQLKATIS